MQAQEGQWDFAQKSRGHDWTCSSSRCATLPATTPLVLPTHLCRCLFGLFLLDLFEHKSESMQILLESLPICFQPSETWADRSESLLCLWEFFLAPHCSCTTDASTAAAYFLITVEDPHKTVYTRQAMIPPKSCTLDPSRRLQQTLSPQTSNISCLVKHSLVCASKERESSLSPLG